jgi:hypothetical protein
MSSSCVWRETLRPAWYIVLNDPKLSTLFFASRYGQSFDPNDVRYPLPSWFVLPGIGAITNYLCLCLFIVELRGLPHFVM